MADNRHDPLMGFVFKVEIQNIGVIGCSEVGGLSTETEVVEYRNGDEDITKHLLPGLKKYGKISLKRGYTPNGKELWGWRKLVMDGQTQRQSGKITLRTESQKPALEWEFHDAWPSKWAGPALNAKNNEVAIEELEICVEYLGLLTS